MGVWIKAPDSLGACCDCEPAVCDSCSSCPTFTVTCRSKSASKTKCGFGPFDASSDKRWRVKTFSGTLALELVSNLLNEFDEVIGCDGEHSCDESTSWSGAYTYDSSCAYLDTFVQDFTSDCGAFSLGAASYSSLTTAETTNTYAGPSCEYNSLNRKWSGSLVETLSSEYTTAQLLTDCETALGVASWSSFSETCLSALYSVSGDELTITLRQVEHKVTFDAPTPAGCRLEWDVYLDGVFYAHNCVNLSTGATEYTDLVFQPASPGAYTLTDWAISSAAC